MNTPSNGGDSALTEQSNCVENRVRDSVKEEKDCMREKKGTYNLVASLYSQSKGVKSIVYKGKITTEGLKDDAYLCESTSKLYSENIFQETKKVIEESDDRNTKPNQLNEAESTNNSTLNTTRKTTQKINPKKIAVKSGQKP